MPDFFPLVRDLVTDQLKLPADSSHHRQSSLEDPQWGLDSMRFITLAGQLNQRLHLHEAGNEELLLRRRTLGDWADIAGDAWTEGTHSVSFFTSGTTGHPKKITHLRSHLEEEIEFLTSLFPHTHRIIASVPAHHIYGFLFTILLPAKLKALRIEGLDRLPSSLPRDLEAGDLIIGHPQFWQWFNETDLPIPEGVQGVTSTAPCSIELQNEIRRKGIPLTEIYGSTETGGIGFRNDPSQPFELFPYLKKVGISLQRETREIEVMDELQWNSPHSFFPLGRKDGQVQVAGTNVSPTEIAQRLSDHPLVQEAAIRSDENGRLKAFIVPSDHNAENWLQEIREWCHDQLSAPERPVGFTTGDHLPRNALGKLQDWT